MKKTEIEIYIDNMTELKGDLAIPDNSKGLIIFSHGSGSSRFSSRNRYVAEKLNKNGMSTLLTDLLTEEEDRVYRNRFNIELLTERLIAVTDYTVRYHAPEKTAVGFFGASTGAASALKAAAELKNRIAAIVSRGGRPDLAGDSLQNVLAPTLLIIGSLDTDVIVLNREAYRQLKCEKELRIVNGASHLFEEPGKLDEVSDLAFHWFNQHLISKYEITKNK